MSYFLDLERLVAFLPAFLGGRPSFGLGINASTDLPRFSQPAIAGVSRFLTRPGKLCRARLEILASVVRLVPV